MNKEQFLKKLKKKISILEESEIEDSNVDDEFIKIRINNCFVTAQKQSLEKAKKELIQIADNCDIKGEIKSILLDSNVVASSNTNLILICKNNHNVNKANKMLKEIENIFNTETNNEYKIIFLNENRWQKEKEKYILNLKNKYVYKYIPEKEDNSNETEEEIVINAVFDKSKVEVI